MNALRPMLLMLTLLLIGGAGADPTTKPSTSIPPGGCVTEACHASIKNFKVLHGPVNVNACDACHTLKSAEGHTFAPAREQQNLCTFCHKVDLAGAKVTHKPVMEGQCIQCHNPHGGNTNKFTRGKTLNETCARCHKDVMAGKKKVHGPVAAGACDSCHNSHSADHAKLLKAAGKDLCFNCHNEMKNQMAQVKFQHKAVEQDCNACHDPHASDFPMQTKQPPVELCTKCHEKQKTAALDAKVKHSIVTRDDACLNCHTAHGGDLAKLMRSEPQKVCMKCHATPQKAPDGRQVASVEEVLDPNMSKHGPIREGNCSGCHDTHGSDHTRLLTKGYPEPFYQAFSVDKYDLCFSCHDKELVLQKKTKGLTGFRNGEQNLHFLHVNKSDRGRNCRACHETHASVSPMHVRDSVPYGNWKMPLNFAKTETGGSCSPGCHKQFAYDRNQPVDYTVKPEPATQPGVIASQPTTRPTP